MPPSQPRVVPAVRGRTADEPVVPAQPAEERIFVERPGPELQPRAAPAVAEVPHAPMPPRVVIGRLSVEIVHAPPTRTQPAPAQVAPAPLAAPANDEAASSKLRFGLGQV